MLGFNSALLRDWVWCDVVVGGCIEDSSEKGKRRLTLLRAQSHARKSDGILGKWSEPLSSSSNPDRHHDLFIGMVTRKGEEVKRKKVGWSEGSRGGREVGCPESIILFGEVW